MMDLDHAACIQRALGHNSDWSLLAEPSQPPSNAIYNHNPKLVIVASGHHAVLLESGKVRIPPGGLLIYRPGSWHQIAAGGKRVYCSLIFAPDRLRFFARAHPGGDDPGEGEVRLCPRPDDPVIRHLLAALSSCNDVAVATDIARALWRRCLPLLRGPDADPGSTWQRIRAYLETHAHTSLGRDAVSAACGISPGHLSNLCRHETGRRFIEVATETRMRHAEHLLRERHMTVSAVADALGFTDLRHFRRVFKRALGTPPGAVRQTQ